MAKSPFHSFLPISALSACVFERVRLRPPLCSSGRYKTDITDLLYALHDHRKYWQTLILSPSTYSTSMYVRLRISGQFPSVYTITDTSRLLRHTPGTMIVSACFGAVEHFRERLRL
ncbi:hypothetical protein B0I72DRAFT_131038 [Yarrowia lipolytica]|uniref:Uncharacterized protein n=1 Tax=Yarrowia lipolytica TaxID=4952 RepID=A0A371C931_YARLL|nr:hypothetical protein BKA91DRAFT_165971 [Yarrowia lipolytica]KAE8170844.1 hypothetical protein BKA90DRAFT_169757 [Yarrowia lipolytica]KAJ8054335.1 hypothetical protein LXG23DRAFT_36436 [Yarrowia lipolytica]RDW26570.1 hypothetical protein B0I71DRAFT_164262 [Yarrowia lipolytica]RDW30403.1 hypothetical protein B0I72DRAFT_131038 [Yarrowia lipolytica]